MIDKLVSATTVTPSVSSDKSKRIIVIDAGIATENNLRMITEKGYDYVCVSRSSLKQYSVVEGASPVVVLDNKQRPIELVQVQTADTADRSYYLKVTSPSKSLKENSMYRQFFTRYRVLRIYCVLRT